MARSTFKVLFYVNGSKEKNGIVPIMGRVTINGTVAQFSCKQSVPKTLWDIKGNRVKGKSKEARDINLALDNIKAQIIKHYQRIFDRENEVFKKRVGKDRVMATYHSRVRARNHVAAFIKSFYRRTDMSMLEITPDFIKEFAAYLSTEAGLHNGTIWEKCMWLKGVVMRAHFNGLIPRNPFAQFHISPNVKEREYLTEDELKALMTHEFGDAKLSYIRDIFVFASFTALSFVDIKELTYDNIVEVNGEKWILSKRHKTKVPFQVKLLDIPLQIIERYRPLQENNLVFPNLNYWSIWRMVINLCNENKSSTFAESKTAMEKNPYIELAECLLPEEMVEYFEVVKVEKTSETLDVTLEERDNGVEGYKSGELRPNGFYEESIVRDYPVRGRKMSFHIKRRRWVEIETGKSVSRCWDLVAEGTRFSKEFAAFLKDMLGQIPDYGPLS